MSNLSTLVSLLKNDLEAQLIPVAIGGLQILQKSPNAAGAIAAEAYVLGNAPAALLSGETTLLQAAITDLQTQLAKIQTPAATAA
jgi:hypothetical protein